MKCKEFLLVLLDEHEVRLKKELKNQESLIKHVYNKEYHEIKAKRIQVELELIEKAREELNKED